MSSLRRHLIGDDGDLGDDEAGDEDRAVNETARSTRTARVLSSYNIPRDLAPTNGEKKLWIITDFAGDDTVTTVLFPGDY